MVTMSRLGTEPNNKDLNDLPLEHVHIIFIDESEASDGQVQTTRRIQPPSSINFEINLKVALENTSHATQARRLGNKFHNKIKFGRARL